MASCLKVESKSFNDLPQNGNGTREEKYNEKKKENEKDVKKTYPPTPPLQGERAKGVSEVGFHLSIFPWSSFIFFSESEHLSRSSGLDLGGCIIFCLWLHCIIFSFCFFRPPAGVSLFRMHAPQNSLAENKIIRATSTESTPGSGIIASSFFRASERNVRQFYGGWFWQVWGLKEKKDDATASKETPAGRFGA